MVLREIQLLEKRGGKSGTFLRRARPTPHAKPRRVR
jgi:hypothetical protein